MTTRNIWLTSDSHFNHDRILTFTSSKQLGQKVRPEFSSVEEMNETMIENWNKVVKQGDVVYHLGDVMFGDKDSFKKLWPRLAGRKRLIVGNHDDIKFLSAGGFFQKVMMWRMFPEFGLTLSHVPLHESGLWRGADSSNVMLNVHGHTHEQGSPEGPYKSVCVELTNYTPVNIEDLRTR